MMNWLRSALAPVGADLDSAFMFGSILDRSRIPRDVDVLLIARGGAGDPSWLRVRRRRDHIAPPFLRRFGLPLSAKVLTLSEWAELDGVFFKQREPFL